MAPSKKPIHLDPRYKNMTVEGAKFIFAKFQHDFPDYDFTPNHRITKTREGKLAIELYCLALGWAVREDKMVECGVDPRFADYLLNENPPELRGRPVTTGSSEQAEVRWRPSNEDRAILDKVKNPGESDGDVCRRGIRALLPPRA